MPFWSNTANTPFAESVQKITLSVTEAISQSFTRAGLIIGTAGLIFLAIYLL
jgi:hypothetical protein